MPSSRERDQITNRILRVLPAATWERLRPALEPLRMVRGQTLGHVDGPIRYMYFIDRGLVSLVKTMLDGRSVEIEAVGIEGITDPNALFGIEIDPAENAKGGPCITRARARTSAWVIPTDEDLMIARHAWALVTASTAPKEG